MADWIGLEKLGNNNQGTTFFFSKILQTLQKKVKSVKINKFATITLHYLSKVISHMRHKCWKHRQDYQLGRYAKVFIIDFVYFKNDGEKNVPSKRRKKHYWVKKTKPTRGPEENRRLK